MSVCDSTHREGRIPVGTRVCADLHMLVHSYMNSSVLGGKARQLSSQLKNQSLQPFWLGADHHSLLLELISGMEQWSSIHHNICHNCYSISEPRNTFYVEKYGHKQ